MPRSRVGLLSWVIAIAFLAGTALIYVDRLNLYATPPDLPNANIVDRVLGTLAYRQQIWPVFFWTNAMFAIGFTAAVAFAANVAAGSGVRDGLPTFKSLVAVGGIMGAIAAVIPIGSVNAAVWLGYCDCGFKQTEIVSQVWAQMVAQDVGDWINRFGGIVLAIGLFALTREAGDLLSPSLRTLTYIGAILVAAAPIIQTIELGPPEVVDLISTVTAPVIAVWAVWLGRTIEARGAAASMAATPT
jgi:hypothetical protein